MWKSDNNVEKCRSDNLLKESLLRQLSQAIQEIQLYYSQNGEVCSTQEGTTSLIEVLESIFLHAMKINFLSSALKSMSVADDTKPSPSFYKAVSPVTHRDVLARISKLNRLTCDAGRSRAWIRLALNENAMSSYFMALRSERRITRNYSPTAFLRDREALDTAANLIEGLLLIPFDIPLNSSLLNIWSSQPLLLSGIWSPAIKASVQMALDVAGSIEDDFDDSISEVTGSSSVRSFQTLDGSLAFSLIFNTPINAPAQPDLPEEIIQEVDKKMEELREERVDILQRSYSYVVESCSPKNEHLFPVSITNTENEDPSIAEPPNLEVPNVQSIKSETKNEQETDYSELFTNNTLNEEPLGEINNENIQTIEEPVVQGPIENFLMRIPREIGLRDQCYQCVDCQLSIGLNYSTAILCHVTGNYLCENCHKINLGVIPSRIIYNWDYNKYPRGNKTADYIGSILTKPIFDLNVINKKLYGAIPEINEMLHLRKQLNLLNLYLSTCKQPTKLPIRDYIYDNPHLYALSDLLSIPNGGLKAEIIKSICQGKNHVTNCWFCKEKGFICELCKDVKVIYPFDEGSIYRCNKCNAVYHGTCLTERKNCPKCKRKSTRTQNEK